MNKSTDLSKRRREYLGRKAEIALLSLLGGAIFLVGAAGLVATCLLMIAGFYNALCSPLTFEDAPGRAGLDVLFCGSLCLGAFGSIFLLGRWLLRVCKDETDCLPYIPPVHEQIATFPAEEVLLRGSQVSGASPKELLRAAGSEETKAEELLRPTSAIMKRKETAKSQRI